MEHNEHPRVVILGAGIAGIEAMLALADLAGDRIEIAIVAPEPEFVLKPMVVEEPFLMKPAERHDVAAAAAQVGARFVLGAATRIAARKHTVELADGTQLGYEHLIVALGARSVVALPSAETFWAGRSDLQIDGMIDRAAESASGTLALVVPGGCTWSFPAYELALMSRSRADHLGHGDLRIEICTPEPGPIAIFGPTASDAVLQVLRARRIGFIGNATAEESDRGTICLQPEGARLDAEVVISIPRLVGPRMTGLPADAAGFLPIDPTCRIHGCEDVYAVGDGSSFPVKQGGIATQQADAVAELIAEACGAELVAKPFEPVLRGQLIAGEESLFMKQELTGEPGEGSFSPVYLWWPPGKVSGRYLTPWLAGDSDGTDPTPPSLPLDVEVALGSEWHSVPMAMGSHPNPR